MMLPRKFVWQCVAVLTLTLGLVSGPASADPYDIAIGQAAAAVEIARSCPKLALIGSGGEQSFVEAASDLIKAQGLKPNRFKKLWFYGQTLWISQMKFNAFAARGISAADGSAICALGRKVAGQNDTIGRFLTRD